MEDDRLRIFRGDTSALAAERVIDAKGRVVTPGFIDMHAHSGLVILAEPLHEPKVRQGVTTEVIGVDGNSYAPFRERPNHPYCARQRLHGRTCRTCAFCRSPGRCGQH